MGAAKPFITEALPYLMMAGGEYYTGQANQPQQPQQQYSEYGGPPPEFGFIMEQLQDMLGGPDWIPGLIEQIQGEAPTPFYEEFLGGAGLTDPQVSQYIANLMSGKGAGERAGRFGEGLRKGVGRSYRGAYNALTEKMAQTGGRHSSAEAKLLAEGIEGYTGAISQAELTTQQYEDQLISDMFGRGGSLMNLVTGMKQGDWSNVMQHLMTLMQGYGFDMASYGMDQNALLNIMSQLAGIGTAYGTTEEGPPWPEIVPGGTPTNPDPNDPYGWYSET